MKRGLVSALAALLVGVGTVMAQAPQAAPPVGNGSTGSPIRQVQGVSGEYPGAGPYPAAPLTTYADPGSLAATGEPVAPAVPNGCGYPPDYRLWASADYLLWRTHSSTTPSGDPRLGEQNGGRVTLGTWVVPQELCGIEGSFFMLEKKSFNVSGSFVAPDGTVGTLANTYSTSLTSGELNARSTLCWFGGCKFGVLGGVRYLNFYEDFNSAAGGTEGFFKTRNNFVGPQVGGDAELTCGPLFFSARFKFAAGPNMEKDETRFTWVPEGNFKAGFICTQYVRIYAGYDVLYIANVNRPTSPLLGTTLLTLNDTNAWFQGFTFGMEVRY